MKVLYLVSKLADGIGGHYISLETTASAIAEVGHDVKVISIGSKEVPILANSPLDYRHIETSGKQIYQVVIEVAKYARDQKIDIIHCFDSYSYSVGRLVAHINKIGIIATKCGGENPKYYPAVSNLVVYSKENLSYFEARPKWSKSKISYIPNRCRKLNDDSEAVGYLRQSLTPNLPVILRIARFAPRHKQGILQSINLLKELNKEIPIAQLVIIGSPSDRAVVQEVTAASVEHCVLLMDPSYTMNASRYIGAADVVIATGRGVMEAASLNKAIMVPLASSQIPVLLDIKNYSQFFLSNFSPRARLESYDETANLKDIKDILSEPDQAKLRSQSSIWFERDFSIDAVVSRYSEIYCQLGRHKERNFIDCLINIAITKKNLLRWGRYASHG